MNDTFFRICSIISTVVFCNFLKLSTMSAVVWIRSNQQSFLSFTFPWPKWVSHNYSSHDVEQKSASLLCFAKWLPGSVQQKGLYGCGTHCQPKCVFHHCAFSNQSLCSVFSSLLLWSSNIMFGFAEKVVYEFMTKSFIWWFEVHSEVQVMKLAYWSLMKSCAIEYDNTFVVMNVQNLFVEGIFLMNISLNLRCCSTLSR
jgi:hypothetical protein